MTDQTSQPLTEQQLKEIEARQKAASKGPWGLSYKYCDCSENCGHGMYVSRINTGAGPATELVDLPRGDWELMVHAREDGDALLAEVRRLRFRLAELGEQGPDDRETVSEAAQMYRSLRTAIEQTMTEPDRWDGDEDESVHLARYVEWLAAGQPGYDEPEQPAAEGAQS
ncbi:hypothetical protein [Streptomyces sp. NPDC008150]|uniref:hypothetical protein n=1 Tax=Streptomyces sp. NPDC008150 TaxID=3364816 RepID=UPI0036E0505C